MYDLTVLRNGCQELNIRLTREQEEQFIKYYEILIEWNKVMNLTGITDFQEVLQKHFVDSLSVVRAVDMGKVSRLIDVGTGAGLEEIQTIHGRAEEYARQRAHREQYDLCVSRAVANLASLSEYCLPYVKVGGFFISYKSGKIQ